MQASEVQLQQAAEEKEEGEQERDSEDEERQRLEKRIKEKDQQIHRRDRDRQRLEERVEHLSEKREQLKGEVGKTRGQLSSGIKQGDPQLQDDMQEDLSSKSQELTDVERECSTYLDMLKNTTSELVSMQKQRWILMQLQLQATRVEQAQPQDEGESQHVFVSARAWTCACVCLIGARAILQPWERRFAMCKMIEPGRELPFLFTFRCLSKWRASLAPLSSKLLTVP